mgnify:CR=1 FL=1
MQHLSFLAVASVGAFLAGCAGKSIPRPPPSLSVSRYSAAIKDSAPQTYVNPTARLLGVRTTDHGLYVDVFVDAGGQSDSAAYQLACYFQRANPEGCLAVEQASGATIPLVPAIMDSRDYVHSFLGEHFGPVVAPCYRVQVPPDRWGAVQVLVVALEGPLPRGNYTARFTTGFVQAPGQLAFISPEPVSFEVR